MKRFLPTYITALLAVMLLSGCSSDEDPITKKTFAETPETFNYVTTEGSRQTGSAMGDVRYTLLFDDDNRSATLTIYDFRLRESEAPAVYVFDDVPWEFSVGTPTVQRVVEVASLTPSYTDGPEHTFTDMRIIFSEANDLDPDGCRGFVADYKVDGLYHVRAYPMSLLCTGTTEIFESSGIAIQSESPEITYEPRMTVDFRPETLTAKVVISDIVLPEGSEPIPAIVIENASVSFGEQGYRLSSAAVTGAGAEVVSFEAVEDEPGDLRMELEFRYGGKSYTLKGFMRSNS